MPSASIAARRSRRRQPNLRSANLNPPRDSYIEDVWNLSSSRFGDAPQNVPNNIWGYVNELTGASSTEIYKGDPGSTSTSSAKRSRRKLYRKKRAFQCCWPRKAPAEIGTNLEFVCGDFRGAPRISQSSDPVPVCVFRRISAE